MFQFSIYKKSLMKILNYLSLILIFSSCNHPNKMTKLIQAIDANLILSDKMQEESLSFKLSHLEKIVSKGRGSMEAKNALKRATKVYQKYQDVIKALDNQPSNQEYFKVYQEYHEWLRKNVKQWNLDIKGKSNGNIDLQKLLYISKDLKSQIKTRIYTKTEMILRYLGADDLFASTVDYFSYAYVIASSSSHFVEKGEKIELSQYILIPQTRSDSLKDLDFETHIDKGFMKELKGNIFEITIPSPKLGKQEFHASFHVKNQAQTLDTTFHLSKTFEVIK